MFPRRSPNTGGVGLKGPKGDTGSVGPQGPKGDTGDIGPAGTTDWAGITNKPVIYTYFPIWAEEGADLDNGAFEWAFGNGNDTPNGTGVVIPFDCELFALGLSHEGAGNTTVEARRNTSAAGKSVSTTSVKSALNEFEDNTVSYEAGDILNFRTVTGNTATNGSVVVAWFRRVVA